MGMGHPGSKGCRICRNLQSNNKINQKMAYFLSLPCIAVLNTLSNKRLLLLRQTAALPPWCAATVTSPSLLYNHSLPLNQIPPLSSSSCLLLFYFFLNLPFSTSFIFTLSISCWRTVCTYYLYLLNFCSLLSPSQSLEALYGKWYLSSVCHSTSWNTLLTFLLPFSCCSSSSWWGHSDLLSVEALKAKP